MAFPQGFRLKAGYYWRLGDRSGPYVVDKDGNARLVGGSGTIVPPPMVLEGWPKPAANVGEPYVFYPVVVSGTGAKTFSIVSGSLPAGLSINASTGVVSGILTTAGSSTFSVRAVDANGEASTIGPFTVRVAATGSILALYGDPVLSAAVGVAYSFQLGASGGVQPYAFAVASGTLPAGVTLNTSTGLVSGTPTTVGVAANIVLRVTDAASETVSLAPFSITVAAAPATLTISGTPPTTATVGTAYSFTPTAAGGVTPRSFALVAGALPTGLSFNTSTGAITGTPTTAGSASGLSIRVTDNVGAIATLASFSITVSAGAQTLPAVTTFAANGDSFGVGNNATTPSVDGWVPLLAASLGATALNQSVSGTVLQNSADSGGSARAQNLRDTFVSTMTGGNARQMAIIARGFNDARYTGAPSTFNVANYENDLGEIVAGLRILGYAADRILIMSPFWISDAGLTIGSAGFTGQTRSGFEAFVAAAQRVATAHGVFFCDAYAGMRDRGGEALMSTDQYHPNNAGHAVIRDLALTTSVRPNTRATAAVTATGGVEQIGFTITAASGATGYEVERSGEGAYAFGNTVTTAGLTGTITGLAAGSYRLRVRPTYAGGLYGPWTYASAAAAVTASGGGGGELFLDDTMTDVDGTAFTAHSADVGGVPVQHASYTPTNGGSAVGGGRLYSRGNAAVYIYTSATPPGANYKVRAYIDCLSEVTGEATGISLRMATGTTAQVIARYQRAAGTWNILQITAGGTATPLGTAFADTFTAGMSRVIEFVANAGTVTLTIYAADGTTVLGTVTGTTAVTGVGFVGTYGGGANAQSQTTGVLISRITAGPLA